jgi:hypothetical protein
VSTSAALGRVLEIDARDAVSTVTRHADFPFEVTSDVLTRASPGYTCANWTDEVALAELRRRDLAFAHQPDLDRLEGFLCAKRRQITHQLTKKGEARSYSDRSRQPRSDRGRAPTHYRVNSARSGLRSRFVHRP